MSNRAKPYLRYLGGKNKVVGQISELLPKTIRRFAEPFCGSAMVYVRLKEEGRIESGILNDNSEWIIRSHRLIRDNPEKFLEIGRKYVEVFRKLRGDKERFKKAYYMVRDKFNANIDQDTPEEILRFIFLSKMGYNGVIRFRDDGTTNIAAGHENLRFVMDEENILRLSEIFKSSTFSSIDFADFLDKIAPIIGESDFIFYDPPYLQTKFKIEDKSKDFNPYSSETFNFYDMERLEKKFEEMSDRGIPEMITLNDHEEIAKLFGKFNIHKIPVSKMKPGTSGFCGDTYEYWITNY